MMCLLSLQKLSRELPVAVLLICLALALAGCASTGPDSVRAGRNAYNTAIKDTDVNQLLLNIVRLRFSDQPYFMDIASISATSEVGGSIGTGGDKGIGTGVSMFERPNIVYTPVAGERFVRQLLEPVDLHTILLLRGAGWEIDDILRVFTSYINEIPNAPTGAGSTPEGTPVYRKFLEVVDALDELEDVNGLDLLAGTGTRSGELVMTVAPKAHKSDAFRRLAELLQLDPKASQFRIHIGLFATKSGRDIAIVTRPILSAMFYLGQSIEIPDSVYEAGIVHSGLAEGEQGPRFDWTKVHKELIRIRTANEPPANAYASVQYGGYWYYVMNTDVDSKETLTMLSVVLRLKAGGESGGGPLLTLPVGGGG